MGAGGFWPGVGTGSVSDGGAGTGSGVGMMGVLLAIVTLLLNYMFWYIPVTRQPCAAVVVGLADVIILPVGLSPRTNIATSTAPAHTPAPIQSLLLFHAVSKNGGVIETVVSAAAVGVTVRTTAKYTYIPIRM